MLPDESRFPRSTGRLGRHIQYGQRACFLQEMLQYVSVDSIDLSPSGLKQEDAESRHFVVPY